MEVMRKRRRTRRRKKLLLLENVPQHSICEKQFNITFIDKTTYSIGIVVDLLRTCCNDRTDVAQINTVKKPSELTSAILSQSHVVFPVHGRERSRRLYGERFLQRVRASSRTEYVALTKTMLRKSTLLIRRNIHGYTML